MIGTRHQRDSALGAEHQRDHEARRAWTEAYGLPLADRLETARRYALVRVGDSEFAFSDYDRYIQAMGEVWAAGLVPEPLPSTLGAELPAVAPRLRELDPDLADMTATDVQRERRFR